MKGLAQLEEAFEDLRSHMSMAWNNAMVWVEDELIFTEMKTLMTVARDATDKVIEATARVAKDHQDNESEGTGKRLWKTSMRGTLVGPAYSGADGPREPDVKEGQGPKHLTNKPGRPKETDRITNTFHIGTTVREGSSILPMGTDGNWPCLEDTDGRFLPHLPGKTVPGPDVIVRRIHMKDEPRVNPVRIFPRLVAMEVLTSRMGH